MTRPLSPSGVPNGEDSKFCAVDGWIDEGWEHVTVHFRSCLAKSPAVFTRSSICPIIALSDFKIYGLAVLSEEVR